MFVHLISLKNEKIAINIDKIMFYTETRDGTAVVLDDGTILKVSMLYEGVNTAIDKVYDSAFFSLYDEEESESSENSEND